MNATEKNLTVIGENGATVEALQAMQMNVNQMGMMMAAMADALRANQIVMEQLAKEVHGLTKVTPMQVKSINGAIRERAAALCAANRANGGETMAANAIRKGVKLAFGITKIGELPRSEYAQAISYVEGWNDFRTMKKIREAVR